MTTAWLIGFFVGGLIPTFIASRFTLMLVSRNERHRFAWLAIAHALSLFICALFFGFASGHGGFDARVENMFGPGFEAGLSAYVLQQAFWLITEYLYRRLRANGGQPVR